MLILHMRDFWKQPSFRQHIAGLHEQTAPVLLTCRRERGPCSSWQAECRSASLLPRLPGLERLPRPAERVTEASLSPSQRLHSRHGMDSSKSDYSTVGCGRLAMLWTQALSRNMTRTSSAAENASSSSGASAISSSLGSALAGVAEPRLTSALCAATRDCGSGSLARTSALSRAAKPSQALGLFA